jgi:hypothetical protein
MAKPADFKRFTFSNDDPLADEHAAVAAWVEDAIASRSEYEYYQEVDLKTFASGQKLLDGSPEQSRRHVLAALAQVRHWERMADEIRSQAKSDMERINAHHQPSWGPVWGRRRQAGAVVSTLMRRALPFQQQDLIEAMDWCNSAEQLSSVFAPIGPITRALKRYAAEKPLDTNLCEVMKQFALRLRSSHDRETKRLGTNIEQICAIDQPVDDLDPAGTVPNQPAPKPEPAGTAAVLASLKRFLGIKANASEPSSTLLPPDDFSLPENSPFKEEHQWLSKLFDDLAATKVWIHPNLTSSVVDQALLPKDPSAVGRIILAAAERHIHSLIRRPAEYTGDWRATYAAASVIAPLVQADFAVDRDQLFDLLLYLSVSPAHTRAGCELVIERLTAQADVEAARTPLGEGERYVLWLFRASRLAVPALGAPPAEVTRLTRLINDGAVFYLAPGEAWSDAVNAELTCLDTARGGAWAMLLKHALTATSGRPSGEWLATGRKLVNEVGGDDVQQALLRWLPRVADGQTIRKLPNYLGDIRGTADVMNEENATVLKGFLWLVPVTPQPGELVRALTAVALSAYRKAPGVGPRAVKVGNAAVYALSEMGSTDAVGQLAVLKARVKFGTAQKEIEKAFTTAAEALKLPRDQVEEMGVPSYGMNEVGLYRESLGDYHSEVIVSGSNAELRWFDSQGKALKSVPAKVKSDHKDDLKELQQSLKDIQSMLPAQRDRIDSLFLLQKTWPLDEWRERYLNHPLVGTIARRLIWRVDRTPALFIDGQGADVHGAAITCGKSAQITLWHPIGCAIDEITQWRQRLEALGVTQPIKQAHREIYLLTDAERNTRTYSNRYAAHVLRQHQFNAVCAARGWKNKLRLMVDDTYPPASKELPAWGLRAEFWIEGIGDNHGTDTNDSGVYLRLSTDQVRFYLTAAAPNLAHAGGGGYESAAHGPGQGDINQPLSLDQIPPLVFSEIMRDVDLFVGVASVGNDPTWQDGGPDGRYRDYWQHYAFGELSGTAATRKQVLECLVPRLKIADRCSFADRFLVVRGHKRTYKIHLGSGNILMEPNDEYLCIVPDSRSRGAQDDLFLPFEGDRTLSIIISKALLLADDAKIKDPTIARQIERR